MLSMLSKTSERDQTHVRAVLPVLGDPSPTGQLRSRTLVLIAAVEPHHPDQDVPFLLPSATLGHENHVIAAISSVRIGAGMGALVIDLGARRA